MHWFIVFILPVVATMSPYTISLKNREVASGWDPERITGQRAPAIAHHPNALMGIKKEATISTPRHFTG
jgi:hypothetical protein